MSRLRRDKTYVAMYTVGTKEPEILGWSCYEYILNHYIEQVRSLDYKTGIDYDIVIISKANSDGLPEEYEITSISDSILVTAMELEYYNPFFKSLYDDMRTTVSTLVLYNKLCGGNSEILQAISMVGLYERCSSFNVFMNSMDKDTILQSYFQHPVMFMDSLIENHIMNDVYRHVVR